VAVGVAVALQKSDGSKRVTRKLSPAVPAPRRADVTPQAADLLDLQRRAGNAATTTLIQRHTGPIQMPVSKSVGAGKSAPSGAERKTNVEDILEDSEEGITAKSIAAEPAPKKPAVAINWEGARNGGSYFQAPSSVTFDIAMTDEQTALAYVHEMNHAAASALGKSADVAALARDDYINATFKEETEGTVLAILAARHTNDAVEAEAEKEKVSAPGMTAGFAFDTEYWKAHDDAAAALPKDTSAADKEKKGRAAGTEKIFSGFKDGTIKTSMPGNPSYVKWYGDIWDAAHPKPAVGTKSK
jgi:hypothetical protein